MKIAKPAFGIDPNLNVEDVTLVDVAAFAGNGSLTTSEVAAAIAESLTKMVATKKPRKPRKPREPAPKATCDRCGTELTASKMEKHQATWTCRERQFSQGVETVLPPGHKWAMSAPSGLHKLGAAAGVEVGVGLLNVGSGFAVWTHGPEWLVVLEGAAQDVRYFHRDDPTLPADVEMVAEYLAGASDVQRDGFLVEMALLEDLSWKDKSDAKRQVLRKFASQVIGDGVSRRVSGRDSST